jgi:hypothetical protein
MLVAGADLIGPRSDFAGFARKKIPFLFFSHGTHKDYHGAGDRAELLDYPKIASDAAIVEQIVADIARSGKKPVYVDKPVYPASEVDTLLRIMNELRAERADLPMAYKLAFADLEQRVRTDHSRATLNVAASSMLALATPRLSPFLLQFIVAPAYQKNNKPEIARALLEESARWER